MKIIYLLRHAKTCGNSQKKYIGCRTDEALSEEGIQEINDSKNDILDLFNEKPDRVIASPMKRAVQTAGLLFEDADITLVDKLKETDFGYFEGKDYSMLNGDPIYQSWIDSDGMADIPDAEERESFLSRSYEGFLEALGDIDRDETIAIVCHGGNIMAIMSRITGEGFYDFMTENLGGYFLKLETGDDGIHCITYHKLGLGNNT